MALTDRLGIAAVRGVFWTGGSQILLADPAGNLIELFQPAHRSGTPTPATT